MVRMFFPPDQDSLKIRLSKSHFINLRFLSASLHGKRSLYATSMKEIAYFMILHPVNTFKNFNFYDYIIFKIPRSLS